MVVAPRETIALEFPFIDLRASKPGDLKGTVTNRVGSKPVKGFFEPIVINPSIARDVADDSVIIMIMKIRS